MWWSHRLCCVWIHSNRPSSVLIRQVLLWGRPPSHPPSPPTPLDITQLRPLGQASSPVSLTGSFIHLFGNHLYSMPQLSLNYGRNKIFEFFVSLFCYVTADQLNCPVQQKSHLAVIHKVMIRRRMLFYEQKNHGRPRSVHATCGPNGIRSMWPGSVRTTWPRSVHVTMWNICSE